MTLEISSPDLRALATGEVVVAFVDRAGCTEGDEVDLVPGPVRSPSEVRPAYRRWLAEDAPSELTAIVIAVDPASLLDPAAGLARHILETTPRSGDLIILRVFDPAGAPVLSDEAFTARRVSVEGAMR